MLFVYIIWLLALVLLYLCVCVYCYYLIEHQYGVDCFRLLEHSLDVLGRLPHPLRDQLRAVHHLQTL
jgi:hypothetical protein